MSFSMYVILTLNSLLLTQVKLNTGPTAHMATQPVSINLLMQEVKGKGITAKELYVQDIPT